MRRWDSRRSRPRPWRGRRRGGLRGRLTRLFALVAIAAVFLTSWLTVSAAFQVLGRVTTGSAHSAPPWAAGGSNRRWDGWWNALDPATQATFREAGRAAGRDLSRSAFLAALLSALLAVFVAALATRQLTRPLVGLAEGARRLTAGERGLRLSLPRRDDELRDLTLAFNAFVDSVERGEAWRRALVADVAHDLRTPLAVLRAEIEAMQDGVNPPDDAGLSRLHGEVLLLARLVDDLRTLSLAEGGALSLRAERVNVAELLATTAPAYEARGACVTVQVGAEVFVHADRDRLAQVLHNLLDNALRYGEGGSIELGAAQNGAEVALSVRDHGPGLPPEALSRAFERFYRADASRTRDPSGRASSGLGLAIVRALVEAQGGAVEVRNHAEGGAQFTVTLPAA